jgi:hypothetical protein
MYISVSNEQKFKNLEVSNYWASLKPLEVLYQKKQNKNKII